MRRWRIGAEKAWTVIFAPDLIEYAFVVISLSAAKLVKLLIFAPLFNAQKKHVLNYFAPVSWVDHLHLMSIGSVYLRLR